MKRILNTLLIIFIFSGSIFSQGDEELQDLFMDAEYFYLYENFDKALPLYLQIYQKDPNNANINYRIGMCYLHLPNEKGQKTLSIPYLERAVKDITTKYSEGSYHERKAPDEALFYLGNGYRYAHQFDKAIEVYKQFIEMLDVGDIFYIEYVEREIQSCYNASELLRLPVELDAESFGEQINSPAQIENCPVVSQDEKTIVFTQGKNNNFSPDIDLGVINHDYTMDNLYFSRKVDDKWTQPENITKDINATKRTVPVTISADGTQLYVVSDDNDDGNIYLCELKKGKWQPMKKLNKFINTKSWESHATITIDGKTLYFTSDRKGGFGGLDIYKTSIDPETGDWGEPVNLGPTINTPFDEETPFILEDSKTLYFSSQGHYSMGGFDIFHSTLIGENQWSSPLNIGYPINTVGNDLFYLPKSNGEYAFFPLNNNDRVNIGNNDIYRIKVSPPETNKTEIILKGKVTTADNRSELPEDFKIFIIDSLSKDTLARLLADKYSGLYNTEVSSGNFRIDYRGSGYKLHVERLFIPKIYTRTEIVINVELIPIEVSKGEYIVIRNLFFDYGKFDLKRESQIELEKLLKIMQQNPAVYVEIVGHTDSKSSATFNKKLSEQRARAAIDYLVEKGIPSERFVAKAMGEDDPVAINENTDGSDNPDGRSLNRRVEIKLLNADPSLVAVEQIVVPDNLTVRGKRDMKYTILIADSKTKLDNSVFTTEKIVANDKDKLMKQLESRTYAKGFIYYVGEYTEKSEAIKDLNKLISFGFAESEIISENDLNVRYPAAQQEVQNQVDNTVYNLDNDIYTIQIKALKTPINLAEFKNLKNIKTYIGKDGYYRYTYGEYIGYNEAKKEIQKIIDLGYPDAFVVNVKKYMKN